jgi:tetrahydromethanopterin S-methyltransferase subunit F
MKLISELRKKLLILSDKLNTSRRKTIVEYLKYDPLFVDAENGHNDTNKDEGI